MISKRIIPLFLLRGSRLVKGTRFEDFVDVGDPTSQAMIYDAQGADEIVIVDIEASAKESLINTQVISSVITKCRLPIACGGGIKDIEDARRCFEAGADKIVINTYAVLNSRLIRNLADEFGSQSVVVSIDVKKNNLGNYDIYIFSGKQKVDMTLTDYLDMVIGNGAGEIIITSIDKEGTLSGFDYKLYSKLKGSVSIPLIASGGAGSYDDITKLFRESDCDACAIGKMLCLRDYDIVRIKSYIKGKKVLVRDA